MTTIRYGNLQVQLLVTHGTRLDRVQMDTPAPRLRLSGLGQAAAPAGIPLVGRADLLDHLAGLSHPGWAVELRAACGFGKSSLLAALAARLADHAAAPAVHLRVGAQPPDDILDQLIGALFTADQPVRPTPQQRVSLLSNVRAIVVLDDVTQEPHQLTELLAALPQCLVLTGSDQPVLDAGGVSVALPGLAGPASLQLLVRDLGRPLGQDEADGAARLCAAVRGQPLRLRQAAALAATGQHTLQRLADRAERDPAALDRLSVHALADAERRVLAVLALAAGAVLPGELVEIVSGVDDLAAQLDKLRRHGLVEQDHDRFGLPRCLGAGYRKLLVANLDIGAAVRPLTTWLAQRDPSSADALAAASAAVQLVGRLADRGDWPELARLAEVTARVLTLAGRWDLCRQVLLQGLHAAQQLGDLAAQARFAHDLGSMALCNDQLQQAEELLNQALALREQLGDHEGAALTRHNLEIMTPPAPPVPPPAQPGRWRERWRKRLPALASLLGLFVFLLVLGLRVIVHAQPPPPTTSTTTTSTKPTTIRTSPPTTNVSHSGPGIAAPGTIQFPPTAIGATTTQPFAIGSIGTGQLRLGSFELSGDSADFAVNDHCRHHTLEPGQSCQPTVTFTPTAQGSRSATLTIHQNLPGPPTHVLLTGTGQPGSDLRPPILKTHDLVMEATSREGAIVGYSVTAIDDVDGDVPVQCQPASGTMFPFGTTHVSCTAADESGKTASGGFSVTVRDSRPPAMTVPDDVTVEAAGPDGAMVEFPQPTASDQVSGPAEARCAPLSGGTFPLGTTTVTCSAVDSHGNEGRASFNVVVRDTTPPKIGTREDILESMPIDDRIDPKLYRVTMAVSFDPPPAWDVVDQNVSVTCDPPSGSQFPADLDPGETTTVTCTAIDDSGNRSGQSQFTVTIVAFPQPH